MYLVDNGALGTEKLLLNTQITITIIIIIIITIIIIIIIMRPPRWSSGQHV